LSSNNNIKIINKIFDYNFKINSNKFITRMMVVVGDFFLSFSFSFIVMGVTIVIVVIIHKVIIVDNYNLNLDFSLMIDFILEDN